MPNLDDILRESQLLKQSLLLKEKEIALLQEKLAYLRRRQFAAASEKLSPNQLSLFDEAETESIEVEETEPNERPETLVEVEAHQRKPRRPSIPDSLPRVEILHDLPEDQKVCPHDGAALKVIGSETHEQLEIIPAKIYVLKHIRQTYACPCCEQYVITELTRSGSVAKELLQEFNATLMVDGYEGYNAVCERNSIIRLGCWAHARRKFYDALVKGKTGKADEALNFIQKLYRVEQLAKNKSAQERCLLRQKEAQLILDKLKTWAEKSLPQVPPKTALGKAFAYLITQWPRLIRYAEDGNYPIDNNPAENAIRPFVIGRKNWLFSTSQKGARASANLYSLIESAKANGQEPFAYLQKIFTQLPNAQTLDDIESLLPWNIKGVV